MSDNDDRADLLYGAPAIAEYLNITKRQVYHLVDKAHLPVFRLTSTLCSADPGAAI